MKWLCTILAFMVLILSIQPVCANASQTDVCCGAGEACKNEQKNAGNEGRHKEDCSGTCNPFQLCACCAFCVVTPNPVVLKTTLTLPIPSIEWGNSSCRFFDEPLSSFWQPPRTV